MTRLPHEVLLPKDREWEFGTPKSVVEPLIDFWCVPSPPKLLVFILTRGLHRLEQYIWRSREETLNTLPQFRTAISPSPSSPALRIHFIHLKSPRQNAVPLLLIPSFPLTNLSLSTSPLFTKLTNPENENDPAFHVICPSIPGLGFSDAFTASSSSVSQLQQTATLFNTLMQRLGHGYYLASATGSGTDSPAGIDYHLLRILGEEFKESCLGVHVVDPCVEKPGIKSGVVGWMKFNVARFFKMRVWGYEEGDWTALTASKNAITNSLSRDSTRNQTTRNAETTPLLRKAGMGYGALTTLGLREPTTLSYALCDSPVGLLSLICSALRKTSPQHTFNQTQIIDLMQLAWLPGPEAGLRFWGDAVGELSLLGNRQMGRRSERRTGSRSGVGKVKMAVTCFNADGGDGERGYV